MHKVMCNIIVFGALAMAASVLNYVEAQTVHVVGDTIGWTVPPGGAAVYSNWASCDTFKVGDILVFNFVSGAHDVLQVPKDSFDACTTRNAIGAPFTDGPAHVTLNSTGDHYFICTVGKHCQLGQKLAVTASGSPPAAGANPPPPTPSPLPSPPTGSVSPPVEPPGSVSRPDGPSGSTTPPPVGVADSPPSRSSAAAVYGAGLALTMASIAMAVNIFLGF